MQEQAELVRLLPSKLWLRFNPALLMLKKYCKNEQLAFQSQTAPLFIIKFLTMKVFSIFIGTFFFCSACFGQIQFNEPAEIKVLLDTWEQVSFANPYAEGWRVQIASTNDLRKAEQIKSAFSANFPSIPIDWVQDYPYYKVRVGAFLEKKETKALIDQIKDLYPGSYAAKDEKISVKDFIPN